MVHPDLTAPGVDISSTCDTTGTIVGPCEPNQNTEASGTSMASPHIAGAAAVLKQANPALTPDQVRLALQATATPVTTDDNSGTLPFWQVGYGYANLDKAVDLVTGRNWAKALSKASAQADARVLAADGWKVARGDFWTYDSPRATVGGTDSHTYTAPVGAGVTELKVSLSHPSLAAVGMNGTSYTVTVKDPAGAVIGTSTESMTAGAGTATVQVPVTTVGEYTFQVVGNYAVSDPDTLDSDSIGGRMVTLHVAQLLKG